MCRPTSPACFMRRSSRHVNAPVICSLPHYDLRGMTDVPFTVVMAGSGELEPDAA